MITVNLTTLKNHLTGLKGEWDLGQESLLGEGGPGQRAECLLDTQPLTSGQGWLKTCSEPRLYLCLSAHTSLSLGLLGLNPGPVL